MKRKIEDISDMLESLTIKQTIKQEQRKRKKSDPDIDELASALFYSNKEVFVEPVDPEKEYIYLVKMGKNLQKIISEKTTDSKKVKQLIKDAFLMFKKYLVWFKHIENLKEGSDKHLKVIKKIIKNIEKFTSNYNQGSNNFYYIESAFSIITEIEMELERLTNE